MNFASNYIKPLLTTTVDAGAYTVSKTLDTVKSVADFVVNVITEEVIAPTIAVRPDEIIIDSLKLLTPYSADTERCVNYVKRRIRTGTFTDMKSRGYITYAISPRESWAFRGHKVDYNHVADEINTWLKTFKEEDGYPISVMWKPSKTVDKRQYGHYFLVQLYKNENESKKKV